MAAYALRMRQVVQPVSQRLRARGFARRDHAFMRTVDESTQAIAFEMGRFEIAAERRPGLHGAFTIECGAWFPEVARVLAQQAPRFVRPYDCHVRQRVGSLFGDGEDAWRTLDGDAGELGAAMADLVDDVVVPWLDGLRTPRDVLAAHEARDPSVTDYVVTPPGVLAALHYVCGDAAAAAEVVRREVATTQHEPAARHLVAWADRLGLAVSMADATVVNMLARERGE